MVGLKGLQPYSKLGHEVAMIALLLALKCSVHKTHRKFPILCSVLKEWIHLSHDLLYTTNYPPIVTEQCGSRAGMHSLSRFQLPKMSPVFKTTATVHFFNISFKMSVPTP